MFPALSKLITMQKEHIPKMFPNLKVSFVSNNYKEAVSCVNSLQSNAAYIKNATRNPPSDVYSSTIAETQKFLLRSGVTLEELDKLSVIHVAGTKGKGSTCAFVESILRQNKYKTGFYLSPHLIAMRERIRIDGKPISEDVFAQNVLKVYTQLLSKREHPNDMPSYFRFLTLVAFHVFLTEKVDVAILEVGIGGEYDCTNIVRNPAVVGISSLGMDHELLLGDTLEEIAWQKAGIMKKDCIAFTVQQPENAMRVLRQRSDEKMCKLYLTPKFEDYWKGTEPTVHLTSTQKTNASLAIQLARNWMLRCGREKIPESIGVYKEIDAQTLAALVSVKWPGRNQVLKSGRNT